jgi:hypothetical protein
LFLFGHVNDAESPFTNLLQQRVRADAFTGGLDRRRLRRGRLAPNRRLVDFKKGVGRGRVGEQGFNPLAKFAVAATGRVEKSGPRFRIREQPGGFYYRSFL